MVNVMVNVMANVMVNNELQEKQLSLIVHVLLMVVLLV